MKKFLLLLFMIFGLWSFSSLAQNEFITTWEVTDADKSIRIPTNQSTFFNLFYDYSVDWGDGTALESNLSTDATHTYAVAGTYEVKISGTFPAIYFNDLFRQDVNSTKIISLDQWGTNPWERLDYSFAGCVNLIYNASDIPVLTNITNLAGVFASCTNFNGNLNNWDVSAITSTREMFRGASAFNQPLNSWNTGLITNMSNMFSGASSFDQPLPWDVSSVTTFNQMFLGATSFNQSLNNWDVSSSLNFIQMFSRASSFNQPLELWANKFSNASSFSGMFRNATAFNQPLNSWNTSSITDFSLMFSGATSFNQPLNNWITSNVTDMSEMFDGASSFDQSLGDWDISSVGNSNVPNLNFSNMIRFTGLSTANYDQTLIGWAAANPPSSVGFNAAGLTYCDGEQARTTLTNTYSWNFGFDSKNCPNSVPSDIALTSASIDENNAVGDLVGTLSTTEDDAGDTHTYTLVTGTGDTDNNSFQINGSSLQAAAVFDFESKSSYSIRVQTADGNGGTYNEAFTITVNDVNEAPVFTSTPVTSATEDVAYSYSVAASDVDAGETLTISATTIPAWLTLTDNGDGTATLSGTPTNAEVGNHSVTLEVSDVTDSKDTQSFTIAVSNTNDTPFFKSTSVTSATEDVAYSYSISASDADSGETLTISATTIPAWLTLTDNGDGTATLSGTPTNAEVGDHSVTLEVSDVAGATATQSFTIAVSNTNDAPVFTSTSVTAATEDAAYSYSISASDVDAGESLTISATTIPTWLTLTDNEDGTATLAGTPTNAEVGDHLVTLEVSDVAGATATQSFTISVSNTNDAPTAISLSATSINENNAIGDVIGSFNATDPEATDTHTYSLVAGTGDGDNGSFTISGSTLEADEVFDFETKSSYSIRVQTNDGNAGTFEENFTISINDVNESTNAAPTAISISNSAIDENNAIGDVIGSFSTTDANAGDTHTYSLAAETGDTDNGSFTIAGGDLEAGEVFDFETKSSYSIRVQTDDGNGGIYSESFTITINDINEAPSNLAISKASITENNAIGDEIGNFITTDEDAGDSFTYTLISGNGDSDNASFTINGANLLAGEVFDHEAKSLYNIRVRTTDSNGETSEKPFGITVFDANDAPVDVILSSNTLAENNAIGDVIGSFSTTDADATDTHTYSLVAGTGDGDNGSFTISGSNLEAAEVFDFETKSSYSIRVQTDDGKGGTFEESFTITINDVEEKQNQTITFDELTDKIYGDASFTLTASADSELAVNFELVSGPVSLNGNEVTITGTGTTTVRATQAGNEAYHSAEPLDQSFDITKAGLMVSADDKIMTYGEALPALTYQIEGFVYSDDENDLSKAVEISTTADQNSNAGTYDITVSGATAANYDLSFEAGTLTVVKAAQEITFGELSDVDIDQSSELSLSATSSSSLAVSFEVVSGPATLNGSSLSLTGTGQVSIRANQEGNENFEAAEAVTQSFNVTSSSKANQTITFETLPEKTYEDAPFDLNATASSGLDVSYTSSDETVASVEGTTVIIIGAGTTTITASQAGNEEYNPAPVVSQTLTVNKADQEITIEEISDKDIEAADFEVVASTTSELELVYAILSGPATLNGNLISLTGEIGTVKIEVTQAGNANYSAASATISFDVVDDPCEGFAATASLIQNVSCNGEVDGSFEVSTSNGTAPFTFNIDNESQDNGLFENRSAGSYEIIVMDANGCTAITSIEISEPEAIEVTAEITDSNSINGNGSITLTVTGGSGNFTFDWSNGATAASLTDLEIGEYSVIVTDEAGCNITESYSIGGVTGNSEAFELNIYPNPVINQVQVVHGEKVNQITLIDANGKIISQQKTQGEQTQLQMNALPAGMYFIRLDDGKMKRIIKQ